MMYIIIDHVENLNVLAGYRLSSPDEPPNIFYYSAVGSPFSSLFFTRITQQGNKLHLNMSKATSKFYAMLLMKLADLR